MHSDVSSNPSCSHPNQPRDHTLVLTTSAPHTHLHLCTVYTRTNLFIVPYCFNVRVVEDQCKLLAPVFKEDLRRRAMVVTLALLYARDEPGTQRAR